jgi:hypothetical protein
MEYWEFLIQREGDRGWRTIETGNLQLKEGKYRIVANSRLIDTQIQTRVTHQTTDPIPQRRFQSRIQTTNPRGLLAIIPFTHLQAGIWQFVCSSASSIPVQHRILKLRVLPLLPTHLPAHPNTPIQAETQDSQPISVPTTRSTHSSIQFQNQIYHPHLSSQVEDDDELIAPTEPLIPISMVAEPENWADGLDRLLAQLERDSLQSPLPKIRPPAPPKIQLTPIVEASTQLISLDRSTFSGLVPGHHLTISGTCNLLRLNANLIKTAKSEKLSICLRHPQSSEIIRSIEQPLPPQLETFTFSGDLELPPELKISLLIGEVNLYDKHHIQLASCGFTVTLNLNPIHESEISFINQFDRHPDPTTATLDQLTQELQLESATIGSHHVDRSIQPLTPSTIPTLNLSPTTPRSQFTHPDVFPVNSSLTTPSLDITGDLEIDFALSSFVRPETARNYENLEIVVDNE